MTTISLIHQGALGDSVLLLPLFRSLRRRFEGAHLNIVTRPNLGQMLTMLGFTDSYASADDRDHALWFADPGDSDNAAPPPNSAPSWGAHDVLISAVSNGRDHWAENARRARRALPDATRGNVHFFEPRPAAGYPAHLTQWHREQLSALGLFEAPPLPPRVNPDGAILIHPGAGGDAKCWPRDRYLSLARSLKRLGLTPTFILGEAEQERWGNALIDSLKGEFPWYLHMGLYELAERMSRARLYLGNDSGVTHLAAALGIDVLALFGPTNDIQWRPPGAGVRVIRAPGPHAASLEHLEEADVLHEVLAELRKL